MIRRTISLLLLSSFLGGCMVGPNYLRPKFNFVHNRYVNSHARTVSVPKPDKPWWFAIHDQTLDQLIKLSLANNPDLEVAAARIEQARARLQYANARFLPEGSTTATALTNQTSLQGLQGLNPFVLRTYGQNQIELDSSWEIDLFGRLRRQRQSAFANLDKAVLDRLANEVSLAAEVAHEYALYRTLQQRIIINQKTAASQQRSWYLNKVRYEAGIAAETDATQAKALLTETNALLPDLQFQLSQSAIRLDILAGQAPGTLEAQLKKAAGVPMVPAIPNPGVPSELLRLRPDILSAEQQLISATADIGANEAEYYPKFTLMGDIGVQALAQRSLLVRDAVYFYAGPSLSWRVLDYWRIDAQVKEARGAQHEALANYKSVILNALGEVETNLVRYQQRYRAVQRYRVNQDTQQRNLDLVREQYRRGLLPFINVVAAERQLYSAQEELVIAKQNFLDSYISLSEALGGGALKTIKLP
ncbi:efflux transporter outer membrane subunit [Legionella dresdenensis]|uniref:Efflux transporter outer membrane subunit n=1 Tax=Legionella dresdenensis TaxID=450200 RepID=A0ABV8CG28_9GAMM